MARNYESYEDFYDNGPGSEAFKRDCRSIGNMQDRLREEKKKREIAKLIEVFEWGYQNVSPAALYDLVTIIESDRFLIGEAIEVWKKS